MDDFNQQKSAGRRAGEHKINFTEQTTQENFRHAVTLGPSLTPRPGAATDGGGGEAASPRHGTEQAPRGQTDKVLHFSSTS